MNKDNELSFNNLNIVLRSFININGLNFPIKVDIAKIKTTDKISEEVYNFTINPDSSPEELKYTIDDTESPFQRKYERLQIRKKILYIYDFLDLEITDEVGKNFLQLLDIENKNEFVKFCLNNYFFTLSDINNIITHIEFLKSKAMKKFTNIAIELLESNKEFPNIALSSDKWEVDKKKSECLRYNYSMITLQPGAEYPMAIWFKENENKALLDFSWREQEMKRLYITTKTKIDNYSEKVKNEITENIKKTSENRPKNAR